MVTVPATRFVLRLIEVKKIFESQVMAMDNLAMVSENRVDVGDNQSM